MRVLLAAALLTLILGVASAAADRRATKDERADIAAVMGVPAKCNRIRVSTVDERFASWTFRRSAVKDTDCRPHLSDGVTILKKRRGRWRELTAGSSFECPIPKVPAAVADDLGIECFKTP